MFALGLEWTQRKERGLLGAYRGRFYVGDVDYSGALLFDPTVPVKGTTSYLGMSNEGQLRYRLPKQRSYWLDLVGAIGLDVWERKFTDRPAGGLPGRLSQARGGDRRRGPRPEWWPAWGSSIRSGSRRTPT